LNTRSQVEIKLYW